MKCEFDKEIAEYRATIPKAYRTLYDKSLSGKSLSDAIAAHCLACCCWNKSEVRDCLAVFCPLYSVRPYKKSRKTARPSVAGRR